MGWFIFFLSFVVLAATWMHGYSCGTADVLLNDYDIWYEVKDDE